MGFFMAVGYELWLSCFRMGNLPTEPFPEACQSSSCSLYVQILIHYLYYTQRICTVHTYYVLYREVVFPFRAVEATLCIVHRN